MKFLYVLFFCLILAFFISCKGQKPAKPVTDAETGIIFTKFPSEETLPFSEVAAIPQLKPDGLLLYKDSLLLIRNASNSSAFHFTIFNLNTRSATGDLLEIGRKPGQAIGILSYGLSGNSIWAHDLIKNKVVISNIDSSVSGKLIPGREFDFTKFYYSIQLLPDSQIAGSGDYDSPQKFDLIRISDNKLLKQMVPYPPDSLSEHPRADKMAYESFLFSRPSGDKCVSACRYTSRIEIVDIPAGKSKIIKGPDNYDPRIVIMIGNDGKEIGTRGPDTKYAFVKGKTTQKYIYLLYSGNPDDTEHLYYGKYIYVYDWDGNPVKKLVLEDYVLDFAVTQDDTALYSYDPVTKKINVSKL